MHDDCRALAPTGTLRIGAYPGSPFSLLRDAATGETRGLVVELGRALATELGVPAAIIEFPRIAEVLEALQSDRIDLGLANVSPARAGEFVWTPPILRIELGYLVPAGSAIASMHAVDRPGLRVGVTAGGTTHRNLTRTLRHAQVVAAATLDDAVSMLADGRLDAYTTNKSNLYAMADRLLGARVLDGRWGIEQLALATPRSREPARDRLCAFAAAAVRDGLVAGAAARAGLRGLAAD